MAQPSNLRARALPLAALLFLLPTPSCATAEIHSLRGTLIGNFISRDAVIVGSDSFIWGDGLAPGARRWNKTCQPTSRSIAAMQGWYSFSLANVAEVQLFQVFQDACSTIRKLGANRTVKAQSAYLVERLKE